MHRIIALLLYFAILLAPALELSGSYYYAAASAAGSPSPDAVWWKLNEGSGTSITGTGTNTGDNGTTNSAWATGKSGSGSCLSFNGSTQGAATSSSITYGVKVITVCCWVNFTDTSSTGIICESSADYTSNINTFALQAHGSNGMRASIGGIVGLFRQESITCPATGAWHHIAVVFDNSTNAGAVTFYLDGSTVSQTIQNNTKNTSFNFSSYILYVGARNSGAAVLTNGKIDDFRLYLSDQSSNIAAIMADAQ